MVISFFTNLVFVFAGNVTLVMPYSLNNFQLVVLLLCTHSIGGELWITIRTISMRARRKEKSSHVKTKLPNEFGIDNGWVIMYYPSNSDLVWVLKDICLNRPHCTWHLFTSTKQKLPRCRGLGHCILDHFTGSMEQLWNNYQVHMQYWTIVDENHGWNVWNQATNRHNNLMTNWLESMLAQRWMVQKFPFANHFTWSALMVGICMHPYD